MLGWFDFSEDLVSPLNPGSWGASCRGYMEMLSGLLSQLSLQDRNRMKRVLRVGVRQVYIPAN